MSLGRRLEIRRYAPVVSIYALAFVARLPSLVRELPPFLFCDEGMWSGLVRRMLSSGAWLPDDYRSGGLNVYPVLIPLRFAGLFGDLVPDDSSLVIFGRVLMPGLLGSAAVIPLFLTVRFLTKSRNAGLLAALCWALSPTALALGRYWYPDHYIGLFSSFFLFILVTRDERSSKRTSWMLGVTFGLALSVKYTGVLLVIPTFVSYLSLGRIDSNFKVVARRFFAAGLQTVSIMSIALVTFLVINPGVIMRWSQFQEGWSYNVNNYSQKSNGVRGVAFYFEQFLMYPFGMFGVVFIIGGLLYLWKSSLHALITCVSLLVTICVYFGVSGYAINRNISLGLPWLLCLVALGICKFQAMLRRQAKWNYVIQVAVVVVALLPLTETAVSIGSDLPVDSRVSATKWIRENIPSSSQIGMNEFCSGPPPIDRSDIAVSFDPMMEQRLDYYVINSYWRSPLFDAYKHVRDQSKFHFYRFDDLKLGKWVNSRPNLAEFLPQGYEVLRVFAGAGPDVVVLKKKN